ncbi:MAG: metallophosphoesterase [Lachnospiraceae bacterium]|nr:metallophosphoesterase [Lachnospiraceae bacterium]
MMKKYATVKYIDFSAYERIIAISDIHGDLEGFEGVLSKYEFSDQDALVIVGDILEKGDQSLPLLKRVKQLSEKGNVHMVLGNNDTAFSNLYSEYFSDEDICHYMNSGKKTVLAEMAKELKLPYGTADEIRRLKSAIKENYGEEYAFLNALPQIIDCEQATFVHAGIQPGKLEEQDWSYCLTAPAFASQPHRFGKPLVIGHWPATNYCDTIIDANVYYNEETNVYSIDGGNSMKSWRQINCLIFRKDGTIESGYYENLPKVRVVEAQKSNDNPVTLTFPNTLIEIREKREEESLCYVPHLHREMMIKNKRIYSYAQKHYCWDFTTYLLPVEAGEIVSYCGKGEEGILIKRNGIVGKYLGEYVLLDDRA